MESEVVAEGGWRGAARKRGCREEREREKAKGGGGGRRELARQKQTSDRGRRDARRHRTFASCRAAQSHE